MVLFLNKGIKIMRLLRFIVVIIGILFSGIFLKLIIAPYIWISLLWVTIFIYLTISSKKLLVRIAFLYIGIVVLTFGVFETYLWLKNKKAEGKTSVAMKSDERYHWVRHPILGYAPQKGKKFTFNIYKGDKILRSIIYTIDSNGLRISPPYRKEASECILFFVCSFTFGEGVSDEETLPYRVGIETGGRYQIYNFGYHGYGPHQMLAMVESGMVDDIIKCSPKYIIYQALFYHIERSAGLVSWDKYGPRYVLNENGEAIFKGHFDDNKIVIPERLQNQLLKSLIMKKIWSKYFAIKHRPINNRDIDLFVAIVDKSKKLFESKYKGSQFHVIFWDDRKNEMYDNLVKKLKDKGIKIHLISDILPDFHKKEVEYQLREQDDTHPNPLAYKIIAEYVAKKIVNE